MSRSDKSGPGMFRPRPNRRLVETSKGALGECGRAELITKAEEGLGLLRLRFWSSVETLPAVGSGS